MCCQSSHWESGAHKTSIPPTRCAHQVLVTFSWACPRTQCPLPPTDIPCQAAPRFQGWGSSQDHSCHLTSTHLDPTLQGSHGAAWPSCCGRSSQVIKMRSPLSYLFWQLAGIAMWLTCWGQFEYHINFAFACVQFPPRETQEKEKIVSAWQGHVSVLNLSSRSRSPSSFHPWQHLSDSGPPRASFGPVSWETDKYLVRFSLCSFHYFTCTKLLPLLGSIMFLKGQWWSF